MNNVLRTLEKAKQLIRQGKNIVTFSDSKIHAFLNASLAWIQSAIYEYSEQIDKQEAENKKLKEQIASMHAAGNKAVQKARNLNTKLTGIQL